MARLVEDELVRSTVLDAVLVDQFGLQTLCDAVIFLIETTLVLDLDKLV